MTAKRDGEMQISERELLAATKDLDEIHHATLPAMQEAIAEWSELNREIRRDDPVLDTRRGSSRRSFLIGGGAAAGSLILAACTSSKKSSSTTTTTSGAAAGPDTGVANTLTGDLAVAALAASLENLAVQTYQNGLDAATAGKLGAIPPAIATFAITAKDQHNAHAAAWNSILTSNSKAPVSGVDTTVKAAVVTPGFAKVKTAVDLAKFALGLEQVAAATYLNGIQNVLQAASAIAIAASIQPVEMQHVAILNLVLGKASGSDYPIPDSFSQTTGARAPSDKIG